MAELEILQKLDEKVNKSGDRLTGDLKTENTIAIGKDQTINQDNGRNIQIATDMKYGGIFDNHSGARLNSIMTGAWGTSQFNVHLSKDWGQYYDEPALSVRQAGVYHLGNELATVNELYNKTSATVFGAEGYLKFQARPSGYSPNIGFYNNDNTGIVTAIGKNPSNEIIIGSGVISGDHSKEIKIGTNGDYIKIGSKTVATTDVATTSSNGLMSSADKSRLDYFGRVFYLGVVSAVSSKWYRVCAISASNQGQHINFDLRNPSGHAMYNIDIAKATAGNGHGVTCKVRNLGCYGYDTNISKIRIGDMGVNNATYVDIQFNKDVERSIEIWENYCTGVRNHSYPALTEVTTTPTSTLTFNVQAGYANSTWNDILLEGWGTTNSANPVMALYTTGLYVGGVKKSISVLELLEEKDEEIATLQSEVLDANINLTDVDLRLLELENAVYSTE